ncbi:unnamed protein product [Phytophthora fragariaefolia]|uniref:Unnamed protein product n=1 Tax=Phytophthora fragariaefolia TaxID=1490495 RepID=A0A9W6XZT1_9STRA|nr:unnamed protein product [Phytophthora fragariaefolia]
MSSAAHASDGSSTTESEDEQTYQESSIKAEPEVITSSPGVEVVSPTEPVVKSEADVVESHVTAEAAEAKLEVSITQHVSITENAATNLDQAHEQSVDSSSPPRCSACKNALLDVPQVDIVQVQEVLDCKCCGLVLPRSSYSKTQRGKETRKCQACTGNVAYGEKHKNKAPSKAKARRQHEASGVFTNKVGRLKMAQMALERKLKEVSKATKRREEYEEQLNKEAMEIARQSALLKRSNPSAFQRLMKDLKIKKPPTYEEDRKKKAKKTKANLKKKQNAKHKADSDMDRAKNKKKKTRGPEVDSSVYVPPASAVDEAPARAISTRSRTRSQPQAVEVKAEVKTELPGVETKTE